MAKCEVIGLTHRGSRAVVLGRLTWAEARGRAEELRKNLQDDNEVGTRCPYLDYRACFRLDQ